MAIPEVQLATWSNQGATTLSAITYTSIKTALESYDWPGDIKWDPFLQGSYGNTTNIRGDSDVDVVVQLTTTEFSNLSPLQKAGLGLQPAAYDFPTFRADIIACLKDYYGATSIDDTHDKSIKLKKSDGRLPADIVPCCTYNLYQSPRSTERGIAFISQRSGKLIVNFPKLHSQNGERKNGDSRTAKKYKHAIRMFKNARNCIIDSKLISRSQCPSYFLECMLYSGADDLYTGTYQDIYCNVVNWLHPKEAAYYNLMLCQNGITSLFGPESTQWNTTDARAVVVALTQLWNEWK